MRFLYSLDFSQKDQKYLHVKLNVKPENYSSEKIVLMMPVWSPGSYLVREYSRFLDLFQANDPKGNPLEFEKIRKNQWEIQLPTEKEFNITYRLYCNEFSVRTNYIDDLHALVIPPATFLLPLEKGLCNYFEVEIKLHPEWNQISTGLDRVEGCENKYYSEDADDFLDCPIEAGNYKTYQFESFGKPHYIAMVGPEIYDGNILVNDIKKVVEATAKIFDDDIPYEHYTFITHLANTASGGIEHKNSSVLHFNRWDFNNPEKYRRMWLSLVSHEYFHLWNVKRIRPSKLASFDYNNENYTSKLWMSEGFTSYFDDHILKRAGIYSDEEYLDVIAYVIERLVKVPGRFYENLESASFDTWIKFYRKHENTNNQSISYYVKGSQLALALDFEIRKNSGNKNNIDDLMKMMWKDYREHPDHGYSKDLLISNAEELAECSLKGLFEEFLEKTTEIDYDRFLSYAGLKLKITDSGKPTLEIDLKEENGLLICSYVMDKGTGYNAGIMPGDEIIAMDGYRVNNASLAKRLKFSKVGAKVKLTISRDERLIDKEIIIAGSKYDSVKVEKIPDPTPEQTEFYNNWLKPY